MKNVKSIIAALAIVLAFGFSANAQETMQKDNMTKGAKVTTVQLEQTKGKFTQQNVSLEAGNYVFAVSNNNAGVDVGFVLVPAGKDVSNPENHIKNAYVSQVVANGKTEKSAVVSLAKGEYVYFCPLNKTPQYSLTVQ
ncbi:MAG: hypothetical protein ABJM06_09805 [Gilvibacter sp.]